MDSKEIEKFVRDHGNEDFQENFLGVFPADRVYKYERRILKVKRNLNMASCIMNTDRYDKPGQHWVALVHLDQYNLFLFDSFGKVGFEHFFIDDDAKILKNFIDFKDYLNSKEDPKNVGLSKLIFNNKKYTENKAYRKYLSDEAKGLCDLFGLMADKNGNGNAPNICCYAMKEELQDPKNFMCGVFCLFFLKHLYEPHVNLGVHNEGKSVKLISKILNGLFTHDEESKYEENTNTLLRFIKKYDIKGKFV